MYKLGISLFFLLSLTWSATGQNLSYDIIKSDKPIGSLTVKKEVSGNQTTYTLKNSVAFKVLFTLNIDYDLQETFEDGVLLSGSGYNSLNSSIQKETSIKKTDTGYLLILDGTPNSIDEKEITYSVSRIYHEEPFDGKPVYSEYFGRYLHVEKVGDQKYILKSPDGENEYTYQYGYCTEVKVSRDFATFFIRMNSSTLAMIKK